MSLKPEVAPTPPPPPPSTDTVTVEVDGRKLQAKKGQMLIQVTDANGIYIPRFCYHDKLSIAANCRMCLVEVEKAPKPLPACATPVMDGMIVRTQSDKARGAQKGTMEFLLINHPLDCPICDQGGECPLQDQAMGYGKDVSRYSEVKRIVKDKDIGPLISTEMTRCIHCTRCVRFGQEIAGVMEFGGIGRSEHMEIRTFLDRSVDSELSGNVIDLCPVGALTSKPYRYTARPWELEDHLSISPHDCIGTNIVVQTRRGQVMRVLPHDNEDVNECWLADRDRYSYQALNSEERLTAPMIRRDGQWVETDWPTALEFTVAGLKKVIQAHGADQVGALASPTATTEEHYLLQKLMRALGSGNVDHRLRQSDFRDDSEAPLYPSLGRSLPEFESLDTILLIGANPRKEVPLLNLRLRKAVRKGARMSVINPLEYDFNYPVAQTVVLAPDAILASVARVAVALGKLKKTSVATDVTLLARGSVTDEEQAIAESLANGKSSAVLLGAFAVSHSSAATLRALARLIAELSGASFGAIAEANAAGAWLAGCVPQRGPNGQAASKSGRHALDMLLKPLKAYLLLGVEPELDALNGARARAAMDAAEFVVMLTSFRPSSQSSHAVEYADVWLPFVPFTESAGTFVNCDGRVQTFNEATAPKGLARPGWKILRVLGTELGVDGFGYLDIAEVRRELGLPQRVALPTQAQATIHKPADSMRLVSGQLWRIAEVPLYRVDALVRRAPALQQTADNSAPVARLHPDQAEKLKLQQGMTVRVVMAEGAAHLPLELDERVPEGCVWVPAGHIETAALGANGAASVVKEGA
jgi:NADH-quinone oxidoreductase subunit G